MCRKYIHGRSPNSNHDGIFQLRELTLYFIRSWWKPSCDRILPLNSQQEFIDDYMAKGKPNHETNGEEPDPEDMGINEDAQTQQDFEQFKAWLQETFGPAASVKRAASSSSLSDGESSVASSSKDGNPECVHPKPAITRRTPIEIATNNSGADSVNLCGSCGKTSCN